MRPHDFWRLADRLIANEKNPEGFRSAVSRAYYAAFLTAEEFLAGMGIALLNRSGAHSELLTILGNTGDPVLDAMQNLLSRLRDDRNVADYDLRDANVETEANARLSVRNSYHVIAELDRCRLDAPRFAAVRRHAGLGEEAPRHSVTGR